MLLYVSPQPGFFHAAVRYQTRMPFDDKQSRRPAVLGLGQSFGRGSQLCFRDTMRSAAIISILAVLPVLTVLASPPNTIRETLSGIAAGKLGPAPLSVTYDDMHGLSGGLTLTIHGDGKVEQRAVREKAGTPQAVSREAVLKLVRLLLRKKAWAQREPERAPRLDESRARLVIQYGNNTTEIWEWYNDLAENQRIVKIRDLMKEIAWTKGHAHSK
jgi:hypothetical protein